MKVRRDEVKVMFDVRKQRLVPAHVEMFVQLIVTNVPLPPIQVYQREGEAGYFLWDGRHRMEAHAQLGTDEIEIDVRQFATEREVMLESFRANVVPGGVARQPTMEDYKFFVRSLMKEQMDEDMIVIELVKMGLPKRFAEKTVSDSARAIHEQNVDAAVAIVREGQTSVIAAASQYGVKPEEIHKKMSRQVYDMKSWRTDVGKAGQILKSLVDDRILKLVRTNPAFQDQAISILLEEMESARRYIEASGLPAVPPKKRKQAA